MRASSVASYCWQGADCADATCPHEHTPARVSVEALEQHARDLVRVGEDGRAALVRRAVAEINALRDLSNV